MCQTPVEGSCASAVLTLITSPSESLYLIYLALVDILKVLAICALCIHSDSNWEEGFLIVGLCVLALLALGVSVAGVRLH